MEVKICIMEQVDRIPVGLLLFRSPTYALFISIMRYHALMLVHVLDSYHLHLSNYTSHTYQSFCDVKLSCNEESMIGNKTYPFVFAFDLPSLRP